MGEGSDPSRGLPLLPAPLPLERDVFLRTLLRHLAGTLEDVVGLDEAAGFIAVVGRRMGQEIDAMYREPIGGAPLDVLGVAAVLADLKQRIGGDFLVTAADASGISLESRSCPFGDKVVGRRSLCSMTSNVFGLIASENLGYAKVTIEAAIAEGAPRCRVRVHLTDDDAARAAEGQEYVRA